MCAIRYLLRLMGTCPFAYLCGSVLWVFHIVVIFFGFSGEYNWKNCFCWWLCIFFFVFRFVLWHCIQIDLLTIRFRFCGQSELFFFEFQSSICLQSLFFFFSNEFYLSVVGGYFLCVVTCLWRCDLARLGFVLGRSTRNSTLGRKDQWLPMYF